MGIRQVTLGNFKSFRHIHVDLGPFNVLIGANAAGKSSFLQAFRFVRDISAHGLDNAISMQGGVEYLLNLRLRWSEPLIVELVLDSPESGRWTIPLSGGNRLQVRELCYRFALQFRKKGSGFDIVEDRLRLAGKILFGEAASHVEAPEGAVTLLNKGGKVESQSELPDGMKCDMQILGRWGVWYVRTKKSLFLDYRSFFMPFLGDLQSIAVYDFDPRLPKKAVPITGKAELDESGENLAIVLNGIIGQVKRRERLSRLLRDLLPFVKGVSMERFADKSLLFALRETYWDDRLLPASLVSDGTINIVALLVALFFESKWVTIIEEPERNLHPHLLSRLVGVIREASESKQILITTQSPEVVRSAPPHSLLLVRRDAEGFSVVSRPHESPDIRTMLRNEIGLDDLFVQNLLESFQ